MQRFTLMAKHIPEEMSEQLILQPATCLQLTRVQAFVDLSLIDVHCDALLLIHNYYSTKASLKVKI